MGDNGFELLSEIGKVQEGGGGRETILRPSRSKRNRLAVEGRPDRHRPQYLVRHPRVYCAGRAYQPRCASARYGRA